MNTIIQKINARPGQRIIAMSDIHGHLENMQGLKIKTACTRQLRFQYFSSFFRQRVQQFLKTGSTGRLSKLTVDAEAVPG